MLLRGRDGLRVEQRVIRWGKLLLPTALILAACAPQTAVEVSEKKVSELKAQVRELESKVEENATENTRLKAQLEAKRALPITVTFRPAYAARGHVAVFATTVKTPVTAAATVKSAALGTSKSFELHLEPDVATEVGGLDGLTFEEGDLITLENQNFSPTRITVHLP